VILILGTPKNIAEIINATTNTHTIHWVFDVGWSFMGHKQNMALTPASIMVAQIFSININETVIM
jgi:hypothetical protein